MTDPSSSSPVKLIEFVRFQLDQLNARNAQHEFEHMCRHFARETITSNILPATGPVGSGGDQGRDFETFTTFISNKKSESAIFLGVGESKPLVFACSIQKSKGLNSKIQADVREICSAGLPYIIYFISNQDVPVSARHKLQEWCAKEFNVRLEIIDGQALSEQLAQPKAFWIAEQYLQVPADLYPPSNTTHSARYDELRAKWFDVSHLPINFADFTEVKSGLRRATFDVALKPDLQRWISVMERFLNHHIDDLRRRATYEVCVATLRGQHNLTAKKQLVESYFEFWGTPTESAEFRDSSVLLTYCSAALLHGEFDTSPNQLHEWSTKLVGSLEIAMSKAPGPNSLAELLQTRAYASHLLFLKSTQPHRDTDEMFKWWFKLISVAKKAPLFPVEDFADLLTKLTPYIGIDPRFETLVRSVDTLLEKRSKGYLVAEKSRDRAFELLKAKKTLAAIDELHRAKVRWFTGDTLKGTILALLTLSDAYLKLGLIYAAKYHAFGAAFLVHRSDEDSLRPYIVDALYQLSQCEYAGGEWMTFSERFPLYLAAHYQHAAEPHDWLNHEPLSRSMAYFLIVKSLATALGGAPLIEKVLEALNSLSMPESLRKEILNPPLPLDVYEQMSVPEIVAKTSQELWGEPFADCGATRIYKWRALGISWSAKCPNTISEIPYAEEFVAVLQIAIADFGRVDLCLLPTSVELDVSVQDAGKFNVKEKANNAKVAFEVFIPRRKSSDLTQLRETQAEVLAVANMLLIWCSGLPDTRVHKILDSAYKNELSAKAFLARPYWELFLEFSLQKDFNARRGDIAKNFDESTFGVREHEELAWNGTPGLGYSKTKAHEFIRNRYRRALLPIRKTLERLKRSAQFQQWVSKLRTEGMLDWQILVLLTNAVLNYRMNHLLKSSNPENLRVHANELMNREELETDPVFPENILYAKEFDLVGKMTIAATIKTWDLVIRRQTPDLIAIKRLLDVRYFHSTDDIPHQDLFSGS